MTDSGTVTLLFTDLVNSTEVALRLCENAAAGQILCSSLVAGLLAGRQTFSFREVGAMRLKGLSTPIAACELLYERGEAASSADMPGRGRHGRRTFRQRR